MAKNWPDNIMAMNLLMVSFRMLVQYQTLLIAVRVKQMHVVDSLGTVFL